MNNILCNNIDSGIGDDFSCFISAASGFGMAGLKKGKPFIEVSLGEIEIKNCLVSGTKMGIDVLKIINENNIN